MSMNNFYYNEQIKRYLIQFMAIFTDMQCQIGKRDNEEEKIIQVPIQYGHKDRVVAHIISANTQNKPLRLPVMSAYLTGINMAPELRKGVNTTRRNTHVTTGGKIPDDMEVIHQLMPVPYKATAELSIYVSNMDQRLQILEQILMVFDPIVQLQTTDAMFDWTKMTTVELENIGFDDNYPSGTDRRVIVSTLNFNFPIYITAPANAKKNFIENIKVRIGTIDLAVKGSANIIADLDGQGIEYEDFFKIEDLILP